MRCHSAAALACVIGVLAPSAGQATTTVSPTQTRTGSYTVSWDESAGLMNNLTYHFYLIQNGVKPGTLVAKTGARTYTNVPGGSPYYSYTYQVAVYRYDGELHKEYFVRNSNVASVAVISPTMPSSPGPVTAPANSSTGSYTVSWGAATLGVIQWYELQENGVFLASVTGLSYAISGRVDGTYRYKVRACNSTNGCSSFTSETAVTVLRPLPAPGPITAPSTSGSGRYDLQWTMRPGYTVSGYKLERQVGSGAWTSIALGPVTTYSDTQSTDAVVSYRVSAWNSLGYGPTTPVVTVNVVLQLTELVPDAPLVQPAVPPQGWDVGTIPGSPNADGGAAGYHIDIVVPPGRAGMQPEIALSYSSKSGNGITGVGWSLSAISTIYRCPRTLSQDGGNRTVRHDAFDRLCYQGSRLVAKSSGAAYGVLNSDYRTEIDEFSRITLLGGDMSQWNSVFVVEHKSGRVSYFKPLKASRTSTTSVPDTWYLDHEEDRRGNCLQYSYTRFVSFDRGGDRSEDEFVLATIDYTGTSGVSISATDTCTLSQQVRHVTFEYTSDRPDIRTTYMDGVASVTAARLRAIITWVGNQGVRRYELGYAPSGSTGRSLLKNVTLCGGATCGAEHLPPTMFSYQESPSHFVRSQYTNGDEPMTIGGDYDGDGTNDYYIKEFTAGTGYSRELHLSGCPSNAISLGDWFDVTNDALGTAFTQDVNLDGKIDALSARVGPDGLYHVAVGTPSCDGTVHYDSGSLTNIIVPAPPSNGYFYASARDADGDGLIDIMYSTVNGVTTYRRTSASSLQFDLTNTVPGPSITAPELDFRIVDVNGDGIGDHLIQTSSDTARTPQDVKRIAFYNIPSPGAPGAYVSKAPTDLGGPSGMLLSQYSFLDVNGDGLPDILDLRNQRLWLNRGGAAGNPWMFVEVALTVPSVKRPGLAFAMDMDGDGREELMVTDDGDQPRVVSYCYIDPNSSSEKPVACGNEFDTPAVGVSIYQDKSVFRWNALKFNESASGGYQAFLVPTDLQASANSPTQVADFNGDGLPDIVFPMINATVGGKPVGYYMGTTPAQLGYYVTQNTSAAADLLTGITNGMGAAAAWRYSPLSGSGDPACTVPAGRRFYTVHLDAPRMPENVFFTSSMWVVASFSVSHGVPATPSMNRTCYRYEDAMLNTGGRGFQGFKKIVAEEQFPKAFGEDPDEHNHATTSEFYQEFPLTNRIKHVTVALAGTDGRVLSETTFGWHVEPRTEFNSAVQIVSTASVREQKYDIAASTKPLIESTSLNEIDRDSGEPSRSCAIVDETKGDSVAPWTKIHMRRSTQTLVNDLSLWWLAKATTAEVADDFLTSFDANVACLEQTYQGAGGSPASLVTMTCTCPTQLSSAAKVQQTVYTWYAATLADGSQRQLDTKELFLKGTSENKTKHYYDPLGNPDHDVVTARAVTGSLTTSYGYSDDKYFVRTVTNPVAHMSTSETDPATGHPTSYQAVQNAPVTTYTYDSIGRLLSTSTTGTQPVYERMASCGSSCIGPSVVVRETFQAGAPTIYEYIDMLGRVVFHEKQGLGDQWILSGVDYNQRGAKVTEYPPWDGEGVSPYTTQYSFIDPLGRVRRRTVNRDPALFSTGMGEPTLTTDYTYTGFRTDIHVYKPVTTGGGFLSMSRTYDSRGKLVETTQQVTDSTRGTHDIVLQYQYDPAGNVTHVVDSNWNDLSAAYDDAGRKLSVSDPDRGAWSFSWDGLSRLVSQTDARGYVVAMGYDGVGRTTSRSLQQPGGSSIPDATWAYDQDGKPGQLSSVSRKSGDGNTDRYVREYRYDALFRPFRVTTHIPEANRQFAQSMLMEYGYDRNYGRLKAVRYPTGDAVVYDYSDEGHRLGETELKPDYSLGDVYRHVNSISARGEVTDQTLGNGIEEAFQYDNAAGLMVWASVVPDRSHNPQLPPTIRQVDYAHDHFLNLQQQKLTMPTLGNAQQNLVFTEVYQYDELQRLKSAARSWINSAPVPGEAVEDDYEYDDLGNILTKSDYASQYNYGSSARGTRNAGPHAVTSVKLVASGSLMDCSYDANGNQTQCGDRSLTFDAFDLPTHIAEPEAVTDFAYAPDGTRYIQYAPAKTVYYIDKDLEYYSRTSGDEIKVYVSDAVVVNYRNGGRQVNYRHLDRLGSLLAATDSNQGELFDETHTFDAFGKPRARDGHPSLDRFHPGGDVGKVTNSGFTKHEQLDDHYLTHMNGRAYDYRLGRFLSVDPIVSNPLSSQSTNPYSYLTNNPLAGVDPTGYCERTLTTGSHISRCGLFNEDQLRVLGKIAFAKGNGAITSGTTIDQASKVIGESIAASFPQAMANITANQAASQATVSDLTLDGGLRAFLPAKTRWAAMQVQSCDLSAQPSPRPLDPSIALDFNPAIEYVWGRLFGTAAAEATQYYAGTGNVLGERIASLGTTENFPVTLFVLQLASGLGQKAPLDDSGLVLNIAKRAEAWGDRIGLPGAGGGSGQGVLKHHYARRLLDRYQAMFGDRGLATEESWLGQMRVNYGTPGSVRLDVVSRYSRWAWDYKFTLNPPSLSASRVARIMSHADIQGITAVGP